MANDSQKVELLFKKYSGVGDAYPGLAVDQELPVSARPKIIPALQIFAQEIPSTAPVDMVEDTGYTGGGQRFVSSSNPHIVQYTRLTLSSIKPGFSYRYSGTIPSLPSTNILSQSIPANFDPCPLDNQ